MDTECSKHSPSASTVDISKEYVRTECTKITRTQSQTIVNRSSFLSFYKLAPVCAASKLSVQSAHSEGTSTDCYTEEEPALWSPLWNCTSSVHTLHATDFLGLFFVKSEARDICGLPICTPCSQKWVCNSGDPLSRHRCGHDRLCSGSWNYCTADLPNCYKTLLPVCQPHQHCTPLWHETCKTLPGMHTFTDFDSTSAFAGWGKKVALNLVTGGEGCREMQLLRDWVCCVWWVHVTLWSLCLLHLLSDPHW